MRSVLMLSSLALMAFACRTQVDTAVEDSDTPDTGPDPQDTAGPEQIPGVPGRMDDPVPPMGTARLDCDFAPLDEPKIPCLFEVRDHSDAIIYEGWAGVERRGRSSLDFPKAQYLVELWRDAAVLVAPGSSWRYLAAGATPAGDWTEANFDDESWSEGAAPLGYGDPGLGTTLERGAGEQELTSWFRRVFVVDDPSTWTRASLALQRDDGVVVYLNGVELLRDNLPDGEITPATPAVGALGADYELEWLPFDVPLGMLMAGTNVLAVELHQAGSESTDLRFDLRLDARGADRDGDMFGMGAEEDWILNGNWVDRAHFRNKLCYDLFQSFGGVPARYAPEQVFVELEIDGDAVGIYTLGEPVKSDFARLDLGEGSFIVKSDDRASPLVSNRVGYGDWVLVHPHGDDASDAELQRATAWLEGWQDAVVAWNYDAEDGIFAWMDMDSAIDFVLIQEFAKNTDAYTLSVHLWRDGDGLLHLTPWDLDLSFGYPVDDCGHEGWNRRQEWVYAMADHPVFSDALAARWRDLRQDAMSDDTVLDWMARYREVIEPSLAANAERWPIDEITFEWGGSDYLCPVESYDDEQERIEAWAIDRLAWMDANIDTF